MRARAQTKQVDRQRRNAADKRLVQTRTALLKVRTGVLLFAESQEQQAQFDTYLDDIERAFDNADTSIPREQRPPHRPEDPTLAFLLDASQRVIRHRPRLGPKRVARYLVQQSAKLHKSERAVLFSAEPHRSQSEQEEEAIQRLADRLSLRARSDRRAKGTIAGT